MANIKPGSEAAKELNLALAQLYNYIRRGTVKNYKAGGWPSGKGIEVDMDELRAAIAAKPERKARAPKGSVKATKALANEIHDALDEETSAKRARRRASGDEGNTVRLHRMGRQELVPCPVDPGHGSVVRVEAEKGKPVRFYCPSQLHDGRSNNHPAGPLPQTQSYFTEEELHTAQPSGRLGIIMLEWIAQGRTDLSEGLEAWLTKNKLPVWIPLR